MLHEILEISSNVITSSEDSLISLESEMLESEILESDMFHLLLEVDIFNESIDNKKKTKKNIFICSH